MGLNDFVKIGSNIRRLREEKGLTQKRMAQLLSIPYSTYSNYENNNRTPTSDTLLRISEVLGVGIWDLLGVDERIAEVSHLKYSDDGEVFVTTAVSEKIVIIMHLLLTLNDNGQSKALEHIELLAKIPEFQKKKED